MTDLDPSALTAMMPFAAVIGMEIEAAAPDRVTGRLEWRADLCTAGGVLHGGAMMAFADSLGAVCGFLNLPEGASGTATSSSHTSLLRAVRAGVVTGEARPVHVGRSQVVVETDLRREDGALVARVTQTQAVL